MSRNEKRKPGKSGDGFEEDVLLDDWPDDNDGSGAADDIFENEILGEDPFLKPMSGRKAWVILSLILVGIAVAVLYVYQAGDRKTVLGNQPIPAVGIMNMGQTLNPVPNAPAGGHLHQMPTVQAPAGGTSTMVTCNACGTNGLPVCGVCGLAMKPLPTNPGLFVCTACGSVGMPMCPHCGGAMSSGAGQNIRTVAATQTPGSPNVGGQFQCPSCRATGLPNWNAAGTPLCPNCGTQMNVNKSAAGTTLAAAP
jgi:uncharacterized paraquat-inducible protein A